MIVRVIRVISLWALASLWIAPAFADDSASFAAGNEAFWQGDFPKAARVYEGLVEAGVHNADVYFNLGNAYAEQGALGKAVWAYEQALLLRPADPDAAHNLAVLIERIVDHLGAEGSEVDRIVPGQSDVGTDLFTALSPSTLAWIAGVCWVLLFTLLIVQRRTRGSHKTALTFASVLLGLGVLASGGLILGRELVVNQTTYGVITADQTRAMVGPGSHYKVRAEVYAGVKVQMKGAEGKWVHITLPNGAGAWLRDRDVSTLIRP